MKHNFVTGDLVTVSFGWDREIYVYLAGVMYEVAKVAILMGRTGTSKSSTKATYNRFGGAHYESW